MFLQRMPVYKLTPNWPNSWVNWKPWNGMHSCFGDQTAIATHPASGTYAFGIDYCYQFFRCCDSININVTGLISNVQCIRTGSCPSICNVLAVCPSCCWLRPHMGYSQDVLQTFYDQLFTFSGAEATLCWCHCWRGFQHAAMCWTAWTNARRLASQFRFWNGKRTARNAKCGWYLDFSKLSWHQEPYQQYCQNNLVM